MPSPQIAARHAAERAMIDREHRAMDAVEARELKALKLALRRKITETDVHSPSLMTYPLHEDEQLHRLHEHLLLLRRKKLAATFNAKANPGRKRRNDERETAATPGRDHHGRPRSR